MKFTANTNSLLIKPSVRPTALTITIFVLKTQRNPNTNFGSIKLTFQRTYAVNLQDVLQ